MPLAMKTDGPLKGEGIPCFETLGKANPPTEDHVTQGPAALYYRCDKVKSPTRWAVLYVRHELKFHALA